MAKRIGAFGAAIAAAAAGGGLALLVKRSLESVDSISKMSDRIGIATEALAGFQHVAQITGVSVEGMNKALEQFVRRIGEAQIKTGETREALENLGLSADHLAAIGVEAAFKEAIDTIGQLTDATARADAAYRLFGRQGVQLLNIINLGSAGMETMIEEAKKLGITFDRLSGAQVEAANDAITRMKAVFAGLGRTLAIEVAPFLDAIATRFTEAATAGKGMATVVVNAFETVVTAVANLADWLGIVKAAWFGLEAGIKLVALGIVGSVDLIAQGFVKFLEFVNSLGGNIPINTAFLDDLRAVMDDLEADIDEAWTAAQKGASDFATGANAKAAADTFRNIRKESEAAAKAVVQAMEDMNTGPFVDQRGGLAAGVEAAAKAFDTLKTAAARVFEATRTPLEQFRKKMAELTRLRFEQLIDDETFARAIAKMRETLAGTLKDTTAKAAIGGTFGAASAQQLGLATIGAPAAGGPLLARTNRVQDEQLDELEGVNRRLDQLIRGGGLSP